MEVCAGVREKKLAALSSVAAALVLVSLKSFLSFATGSLGVLSEALHSMLDLVAAVLTYLSVRVADKPADAEHTYGHGKVENFSAFVETGLLLLTALYIIWEAFQRLLFRHAQIRPSLAAIVILGAAIAIDFGRSRALGRVARQHASEALEADALHFSTDVWSTLVVLVGVAAVWLGQRTGLPWLAYADPIAALGVAGVVIWVASQLGRRTLDALLDAAPRGLQTRIQVAVERLEGVRAERVRVRRAGNRHFVDVTISVARSASLEQAHALSDEVERAIAKIVAADVMVHVEPRAPAGENLFDVVRSVAQRSGLAIHELSAQQLDGRLFLDLHLELDEQLFLRAAHERATQLEESIRRELAAAAEMNIHIEPLGRRIPDAQEMKGLARAVQEHIHSLRSEYHELAGCHEVNVRSAEHKILVSCHCAMEGDLTVAEVHDITAALEDRVRERFPQISQVTIHPEPREEG
jgi:cation diffusion facilitator family transporter